MLLFAQYYKLVLQKSVYHQHHDDDQRTLYDPGHEMIMKKFCFSFHPKNYDTFGRKSPKI